MKIKNWVLVGTVLIVIDGCAFRYGSSQSTMQVHLTSTPSPDLTQCQTALTEAYRSHDSYSTASEVLLYVGVATAVGTGLVAAISAASTPGTGAADVPTAVSREGEISPVEWSTIIIGGVSALSGGLTTVFGTIRGSRQERIERLREIVNNLAAGATVPAADISRWCR